MTKNIILGLLKDQKLTAYDIKKAMEQSIAYFHSSSLGTITSGETLANLSIATSEKFKNRAGKQ